MTIITDEHGSAYEFGGMTTTNSHASLRATIITTAINYQRRRIDNLEERLSILRRENHSRSGESNPSPSPQQQLSAEAYSLSESLRTAREDMRTLQQIKAATHALPRPIALGAIVVTSLNTFFVSVGTEHLQAGARSCIGVAENSPLGQAMKDKKIGEQFTYKTITHTIKDIF